MYIDDDTLRKQLNRILLYKNTKPNSPRDKSQRTKDAPVSVKQLPSAKRRNLINLTQNR
jgi:hypothetical protein